MFDRVLNFVAGILGVFNIALSIVGAIYAFDSLFKGLILFLSFSCFIFGLLLLSWVAKGNRFLKRFIGACTAFAVPKVKEGK